MKKRLTLCLFIILIFIAFFSMQTNTVNADELSDNVAGQLENIDLSELEEYFSNIKGDYSFDLMEYVNGLLNGNYSGDLNSFSGYIIDAFMKSVKELLPVFMLIISIAIICGVLQNFRPSFLSEGTGEVILFVCILSIISILILQIISFISNTQIVINNIAKLSEIMSPIIATLMLASGAKISAQIFKPSVVFLSSGVINVFLILILPLITLFMIFNVISSFSNCVKLNKFSELTVSVIKWVIGIIITIFGVFISVQGITSATFDGISIKAAKYAISNSIPIVGGFIKDGFDLVVAGSVLIKNAVGITSVIALFFTIIGPVLSLVTFSFMLKIASAITEPITDIRISNLFNSSAKCLTYLNVSLLTVGLLFFIMILLMILCANAFI